MSVRWGIVTLVLVLGVSGCYDPPNACNIKCSATSGCPGGMECVDNFCRTDDDTGCPVPAIEFTTISVGGNHACGISTQSQLYCWGSNAYGQLGTSSTADAAAPALVDQQTWIAVSAGGLHTCGLRADGTAWCFGNNADGQVQGDSSSPLATPVLVHDMPGVPPPPFEQIAAGSAHTCAIGAGQLWCWGKTLSIGTNNAPVIATTRIAPAIDDWRSISAGWDHTCALRATGQLYCWGGNASLQSSASGMPVRVPTEVSIAGLSVLAVAAGDEGTCAIAAATPDATLGQLYCWGINTGSLVDDTNMNVAVPRQMGAADKWRAIEAGISERCAIDSMGMAWCWGRTFSGSLATGLWQDERTFDKARAIGSFEQVSFGFGTSTNGTNATAFGCARNATHVSCWGDNGSGELGTGQASKRLVPSKISAPAGAWTALHAGDNHVCATAGAAMYCWGADTKSQVSAGIARGEANPCIAGEPCDFAVPTAAPSDIPRADEFVLGDTYTCARDNTTIKCWGTGAVGASLDRGFAAVQPPPGTTWKALWGGVVGNCGLTNKDSVACWGNLAGTFQSRPVLAASAEIHDIDEARFGNRFACFHRTIDNARVCWGDNDSGELGDGSMNPATAAMPLVLDVGESMRTTVGLSHGCSITSTQGVVCWGYNYHGEVGRSSTMQSVPTPFPVASSAGPLASCTKLALGASHSCAICSGVVHCWGESVDGALGRARTAPATPSHIADPITLTGEVFVEISARADGTCGLTQDGDIYCWGAGRHGENGDGGQARNLPTLVGG